MICSEKGGMGIEEIDKKYIYVFNAHPIEGFSDNQYKEA